jgi:hypothetical protein
MKEPFHTLIWKASIGYNDSWSQVDPEVLEKFAELIVKECMSKTAGYLLEDEFGGPDVKEASEELAKHFGVE